MATKESTTSIYFTQNSQTEQRHTKRQNSTEEEGVTPSKKRAKNREYSQSPSRQTSTSRFFSPNLVDGDDARKLRLEAKKKRLLAENNPFLKRQNSVQPAKQPAVTFSEDDNVHSGEESEEDACSALKALFTSEPKPKKLTRKGTQSSKEDEAYTAGELQAIQLKKQHPGVILMFEVGYKCLFFGDDAQIASRELGIQHSVLRKLPSAMIPMQRREIYLKQLVSKGYKVGLVEQTETRALKKAGANRNAPFSRAVNQIFTAATYVDELSSSDNGIAPSLMSVIEGRKCGRGTNERVTIGVVTVCPTTGEVVWDNFDDTRMRTELETRMVHTRPYELLLPDNDLSRETSKLLNYFVDHSDPDVKIRVEKFGDTFSYSDAFAYISKFYSDTSATNNASAMAIITDFPKVVVIALAHTIRYLAPFDVSRAFRQACHFMEFKNKMHMLLNANTLSNLDVQRNETDFSKKGSLLWILDRTRTRFGARKLRSWIGRPLLNIDLLQERLDAVEEMSSKDGNEVAKQLAQLLVGLPDLEKGLCRIQYGSCTPKELCDILEAFHRIANTFPEYETREDVGCRSKILNEVIFALPKLQHSVRTLGSQIKKGAAKIGEKHRMWEPISKYHDEVEECDETVQFVEWEIQEELKKIREYIGDPKLEFTTVGLEEYLIQLPSAQVKDGSIVIPEKWIFSSSTKNFKRYRTEHVARLMEDRAQHKERLVNKANKAFQSFLGDIAEQYYGLLRDAVNKLAVADCLHSLALVARNLDYVRPQFTEEDVIDISQGRHPMIEVLRSDPFIPNDICIGGDGGRCKIITGPNMGGKSSATRMVAVLAVMAQIGSYVPAQSLKMGMLDAIMTRMGASDELARGRSTFMVEMTETSEILHGSSSRSLVILDELGRGTSTFDGMAIAHAVLQHLVQNVKCKTLFVTHYPLVATELEQRFPKEVQNFHMGYLEDTRINGSRDITFLYRLTRGITAESFGVECGRLANVPESILQLATSKSQSLKSSVDARMRRNKLLNCAKLIQNCIRTNDEIALSELKKAIGSISVPME